MFLVDTNVISEVRKQRFGNRSVIEWSSRVDIADLYLSAITILEIEKGILLLARRDQPQAALLRRWQADRLLPDFAGRILPVDETVALRCAPLHVPDKRPDRDALIAATALVHGLTVVTRNVADFADTGVKLVNPWEA